MLHHIFNFAIIESDSNIADDLASDIHKGVVEVPYAKGKNDPHTLARNSVRGRGSKVMGQIKKKNAKLRKCSYTAPYLSGRIPLGTEIGTLKRKGSFTLSVFISLHN